MLKIYSIRRGDNILHEVMASSKYEAKKKLKNKGYPGPFKLINVREPKIDENSCKFLIQDDINKPA